MQTSSGDLILTSRLLFKGKYCDVRLTQSKVSVKEQDEHVKFTIRDPYDFDINICDIFAIHPFSEEHIVRAKQEILHSDVNFSNSFTVCYLSGMTEHLRNLSKLKQIDKPFPKAVSFKLVTRTFTCVNAEECKYWVVTLARHVFGIDASNLTKLYSRKLAIFLNPFSGKRKAVSNFNKLAKPILDCANLTYTVFETKKPGHATELAASLDLSVYDGILGFGGDGTLNESIAGLMKRKDWATAIKVPLAAIPSGTSNGFAAAMGTPDIQSAIFACARGFYRPMDLISVVQGEKRYYGFMGVAWAAVADVDIGTENVRWMGALRNTYGGIKSIANPKTYHGVLKFVPVEDDEYQQELSGRADVNTKYSAFHYAPARHNPDPSSANNVCPGSDGPVCVHLSSMFPEFKLNTPIASAVDQQATGIKGDLKPEYNDENNNNNNAKASSVLYSAAATRTTTTTTVTTREVKGQFYYFIAMNTSHLAKDTKASPFSQLYDGCIDLIWVTSPEPLKRTKLLKMFAELDTGAYIKNKIVQHAKCRAFSLEPVSKGSFVTIDGENLEYTTTYSECHRGLCNVFCL